jgi:hypothetical protein
VFTSKSGRICSFYGKTQIFDVYVKTPLDLNNIHYLRLAPYSSNTIIHNNIIYRIIFILLKISNEHHRSFPFFLDVVLPHHGSKTPTIPSPGCTPEWLTIGGNGCRQVSATRYCTGVFTRYWSGQDLE